MPLPRYLNGHTRELKTEEGVSPPPLGRHGPLPWVAKAHGDPGPVVWGPDPGTRTGVVLEHRGREPSQPSRQTEELIPLDQSGERPPIESHQVAFARVAPEPNQAWSVVTLTVPLGPPCLQIVGANPRRSRLTILNQDPLNPVLIGAHPSLAVGSVSAFSLPAGAALSCYHTRQVYAVASTAAVQVSYKAEFSADPEPVVTKHPKWARGEDAPSGLFVARSWVKP